MDGLHGSVLRLDLAGHEFQLTLTLLFVELAGHEFHLTLTLLFVESLAMGLVLDEVLLVRRFRELELTQQLMGILLRTSSNGGTGR